MDTFFEIKIPKSVNNDQIYKETINITREIDLKLNRYNDKSEISEINRRGFSKNVKVSTETINVIKRSIFYSEISDGYFDITFEPIQNLFKFNTEIQILPDRSEIEEAKKLVNYKYIDIDTQNGEIRILKEGVILNLSSIIKGYTLDRVSEYFNNMNVPEYYLNFGGNLLIKSREGLVAGIKHPRKEEIISKIFVSNTSVSTSADYHQFFEKDGVRYIHIIDPKTGNAAFKKQSVTAVTKKGIDSDFLSTIIFILDNEKSKYLIDNYFPGSGYLIIEDEKISYEYNILFK